MTDDILNETSRNYQNRMKPIELPTTIPKLEYKYLQTGGNKRNRPILINYGQSNKFIDNSDVNAFKNSVLSTQSRFVYPLEFVNIAKKYAYVTSDKLMFSDTHLRKLQIWSNQLREMSSKEDRNFDAENYLAYVICLKAIEYATGDNK